MTGTPASLAFALAFVIVTTLALRIGPGFRAWQPPEQINFAVMAAALWPWTLATLFLDHTPTAWTIAAFTVGGIAAAVFVVRQIIWLRQTRRDLIALQTQMLREHPDTDE